MSSTIRPFTDKELLSLAGNTHNFKGYPTGYWFLFMRAKKLMPDKFNDKFYLFRGQNFQKLYIGTTNAGLAGLKKPMNPKGCAVVKSGEWYYDAWARGMHHQKVWAYTQFKSLLVYRDNDRDDYAEETGPIYSGQYNINIHPASYIKGSTVKRALVGPWSAGCFVFEVRADEDEFMMNTTGQTLLSACVIKEP